MCPSFQIADERRGRGNRPDGRARACTAAPRYAPSGNTLYYPAIPARTPAKTWSRAALLGGAAGIGALLAPERMELGDPPNGEVRANQAMTIAWYVAGALAAAVAANSMRYGRLPG